MASYSNCILYIYKFLKLSNDSTQDKRQHLSIASLPHESNHIYGILVFDSNCNCNISSITCFSSIHYENKVYCISTDNAHEPVSFGPRWDDQVLSDDNVPKHPWSWGKRHCRKRWRGRHQCPTRYILFNFVNFYVTVTVIHVVSVCPGFLYLEPSSGGFLF